MFLALTAVLAATRLLTAGPPETVEYEKLLADPAKYEGKTVAVRATVAGAVVEGRGKYIRLSVNGRSAEVGANKGKPGSVNFVVPKNQKGMLLKDWKADATYAADLTVTLTSGPKGKQWFAVVSGIAVKTPAEVVASTPAPVSSPAATPTRTTPPVAAPPLTPKTEPKTAELAPVTRAKLSDEARAAREFTFEKTALGSSLDDFKKRYPNAAERESDHNVGHVLLIANAESATVCGYAFFENRLYQMRVIYSAEAIDKLGGINTFMDRLKKKFGPYNPSDFVVENDPFKANIVWRFKDADRQVELIVNKEFVRLDVTDTKLLAGLKTKRAKSAKTGFDD
jgi:hypothetical protein